MSELPVILISAGVNDNFGAKAATELAADLKSHMNNGIVPPHAICIPPRGARQSERWQSIFRDQIAEIECCGGVAITILPRTGFMTGSQIEECHMLKELGRRWRLWLPKDPLDDNISEQVVKVIQGGGNVLDLGVSSARWIHRLQFNPTNLQDFTKMEIYMLSDESERNETAALALTAIGAAGGTILGVMALPHVLLVKSIALVALPAPCLYAFYQLEQKMIANARNVSTEELGSWRHSYREGVLGDQSLCQMGKAWYPCSIYKGEPTRDFSEGDRILDSWVFHCTVSNTNQAKLANLAEIEIVLPKERILLSQKSFNKITIDYEKWKQEQKEHITTLR